VQPPLVGSEVVEESQQILMAEEAALDADMEAKLRDDVEAIARWRRGGSYDPSGEPAG
jgi:hypothetical protein